MKLSLNGNWECTFTDSDIPSSDIMLPGTIQASGITPLNSKREEDTLTDEHAFEGIISLRKEVQIPLGYDSYILTLERSRITRLYIDGQAVGTCDSLIAPHVYDISAFITKENTLIQIEADNKNYPCPGGHLTSRDTQTNWSGILGDMYIKCTNNTHIVSVNARTDYSKKVAILTLNTSTSAFDISSQDMSSIKDASTYDTLDSSLGINIRTDLIKLKDEYLNKDADPSIFRKFRDDIDLAAKSTDLDILKEHLEIAKDIVKPQSFTISKGPIVIDLEDKDGKVYEWDTFTPYLYAFTLDLCDSNGTILDSTRTICGLRSFTTRENELLLNNRPIFLRGRHCGLLFPMTGFAPMNACGWLYDMMISRRWGINHYRFHSCTPPDAAFLAADLLGIVIQSEMEIWGSWLMEDEEGYDATMQQYLTIEGYRMISLFASHPSFCMFGCGNELWGNPKALGKLLAGFKMINPDLLYTQGSNTFQFSPNIQPEDDFFVGVRFSTDRLIRGSYAMCDAPQGHIQTMAPTANINYDANIRPDLISSYGADTISDNTKNDAFDNAGYDKASTTTIQFGTTVKEVTLTSQDELIPFIPVISHETGQFETYPDYDEISHYTGVLKAYNIADLKDKAQKSGLLPYAHDFFINSGTLAMQCYKHEMEDALASTYLAGTQLLDIQDYTGQGTALIGVLNSLMEDKKLISPGKFRESFDDIVVMARFDSYVHSSGSSFGFTPFIAYYDKNIYKNMYVKATLISSLNELVCSKDISIPDITTGARISLPYTSLSFPESKKPERYELQLSLIAGNTTLTTNSYTLYTYPEIEKPLENADTAPITYATSVQEAVNMAKKGQNVLLYLSDAENPNSIEGTYCTDFWCYPMFKSISESMNKEIPIGTLGLCIDNNSMALKDFPSMTYSEPIWYEIVTASRSTILDNTDINPIVSTIDNAYRSHKLGLIYEIKIEGTDGNIIVCTSDLPRLISSNVKEAYALHKSLINYVNNSVHENANTITPDVFKSIFGIDRL